MNIISPSSSPYKQNPFKKKLPPPTQKLPRNALLLSSDFPPMPRDEINEMYEKKIGKIEKKLNEIIKNIDLSNIVNVSKSLLDENNYEYKNEYENELTLLIETFNNCMALSDAGVINLSKCECKNIAKFLKKIIEDLKNDDVHESWYKLSSPLQSPFSMILKIINKMMNDINDYKKPINSDKILLITNTLITYEVLKDKLSKKDQKIGEKISRNYQLYLENTFSFDEEGKAIIAEEREKTDIKLERDKPKPSNPFAKGVKSTCESSLIICENELQKLYEDENIVKPNIIESDQPLSCEEKLQICKETKTRLISLKKDKNIVTQSHEGGKKSRKRKNKNRKSKKRRYAKKID